ncbi:MAG TPA: type I polyketide synthase, partial [Thermoanaerobaculia bacterium]|nr:type I polyketide synthase [Thermoanaerobaculia bacterium]
GFERPHPELETEASPFFVSARLAPWETGALPRRAGVSSFGIGGTNAHLILEEAAPAPPPERSRPGQLLVLSAATEPALAARTTDLADHLARRPDLDLADVAWTLQTGRRPLPCRQAVARADLSQAMTAKPITGRAGSVPPEVVFLFPGQGTQRAGMAGELYRSEPAFRRRLDHCAEVLKSTLGLDLRDCLFPAGNPEAAARRLADTEIAQPALFAVEHCLASLWQDWGVRPAAMFGDSLGEYVAACLAGVFTLEEGLELTAARGRFLAALPEGRMLAVALPVAEVEERLKDGLALAAVHGPRRCVVAGPREAVEALERRLAADGIACRRTPATRAFHSPIMSAAAEPLLAMTSRLDLRAPRIPFLSNVTGGWITVEEATDPRYWVRHLLSPVRLDRGIAELSRGPERLLLEVGPGRTLAAAVGGGKVIASLPEQGSERQGMLTALGRLWVRGVEADWSALHAGEKRSRVRLPVYPFESRRCWLEPGGEVAPWSEPAAASTPVPRAAALPVSERESLLCEIWREVLGVTVVGTDDHFLELGGDSILGALIASRARALGIPVAPEYLFLHPTVAQLAAAVGPIETEAAAAASPFALDPSAVERLLAKRSAGR